MICAFGAGATVAQALSPPIFDHPRGFYSSGFSLQLSVDPADTAPTLRVRYTTDGQPPTPTVGQDYVAPITVGTTAVIRAVVYDSANPTSVSVSVTSSYIFPHDVIAQPANIPSTTDPRFASYPSYPREVYDVGYNRTAVHDYEMDPDIVNNPAYDVAAALVAVPTVSIAVDKATMFGPTGFYDADAEVPASMEILYPDDPASDQQVNCSVQGHSTVRLKRSLRLSFSSSFGPSKLTSTLLQGAPVNGSSAKTSFDTLVLRGGNNRSWARAWNPDATTYTEDEWYRGSQVAMTGVGSHGTFAHLYINGLYWGLYNVAERPDESFAANYLGGKKGDYFSLKEDGRTKGDATRWNYLVTTVLPKNMGVAANYTELKDYLDVGLFSDYLILAWYGGINDWPNNNWWVVNRNVPVAAARYFAWDGEWSWDRGNPFDESIGGETPDGAWVHPAFRAGSTDTSFIASFWRALRVNRDFLTTFADHVYQHTMPGGALSDLSARLRWNALNLYIEDAVVAESARWGDALTPSTPRTRDVDWNREVNVIYGLMGGNGARLIAALRAEGVYPTINPPVFNHAPGAVAAGTALTLTNPNTGGTIYFTVAGTDPRQPGGAVDPAALAYTAPLFITTPLTVNARVFNGAEWSALAVATFNPVAINQPPTVSAVAPIMVAIPSLITADASATDDGLPTGTLIKSWTMLSGPGTATIASPGALSTTVGFSAPGSYVLRFSASDGALTSTADVPVFVYPAPPLARSLDSFTLINADTGGAIAGFEVLTEGAVLDYAALPTRHLNIRANTSPAIVGSVRFALNTKTNFRTESGAPYALAGDSNGVYYAWTPAIGAYTLKGTPYSGSNASGVAGTPLTVHFQVVESGTLDTQPPSMPGSLSAGTIKSTSFVLSWTAATDDVGVTGYEVFRDGVSLGTITATSLSITGLTANTTYAMAVRARDAAGNWSQPASLNVTTTQTTATMAVVSFTLINADTNQPVPGYQVIPDGALIARSSLPTTHLNLVANTSPTIVGSVTITLDGTAKTESEVPYAYFGDTAGVFRSGVIANGTHVLTARAFTKAKGAGTASAPLTISFTIQ